MTSGPVLHLNRPTTSAKAGWDGPGALRRLHTRIPNIARMYNFLLGGKDNYVVDRDLAERALRVAPVLSGLVQVNRVFLYDAACLLAGTAGLRQFLDLGCGLPAHVNLGDVVRPIAPDCRVAYVDNDPMVLSHARAVLAVDRRTGAFAADLRRPGDLFGDPDLAGLIDFDRPVGVFLMDVLPFITDAEGPERIVGELLRGLAPGSHVVISHVERTPTLDAVSALYQEAGIAFTPRCRTWTARLTQDLEPVSAYPAGRPHSGIGVKLVEAMPLAGHIGRKPT